MPEFQKYGPLDRNSDKSETIVLNLDEYETIRLLDQEGLDQEEAAKLMNVARTTVQRIYDEARKKIANALVSGQNLVIEGGHYVFCEKDCNSCVRPRHSNNSSCRHMNGGGKSNESGFGGNR